MKYEKPSLTWLEITVDKPIASPGLGDWLISNEYDTSVENHITTYAVNS